MFGYIHPLSTGNLLLDVVIWLAIVAAGLTLKFTLFK